MCGIFGTFEKNGINEHACRVATDLMTHRGPNDGGYYTSEDKTLFLGHRRLSIIDVSEQANQPMTSRCGRYVIAFNGEIYNFRELKNKLVNFSWSTTGDTEVLLELFAKYGLACFSWLNGFFALAIHDKQDHKLVICRDQLGIKPLFIQRTSDKFIISSELKAIVSCNKVDNEKLNLVVNKTAVAQFLHLGFIPEPRTIYRNIKKFPAANYAILDLQTNDWTRHQYWSAKDYYLTNPISDETIALKQYKEKLFAAVESQMVSDVPLGTFLSGGIDSSLVSAVASKISQKKIKTFSIGFENEAFDESKYAQQVAEHLGTEHHLFTVNQDDILPLITDFLDAYDEPFTDSSAFPTMLVSKLAKEHVTVALSGDGGDELFQGYGMYTWAKRLNIPLNRLMRKPIYAATRLMGERYQRAGAVYNYPAVNRIPSHIFSQEQYLFSEQELKRLLVKKDFDFKKLNELPKTGTAEEKQAFWDIEHYLKDDLLVKIDRASMQYSLETRVPLLDRTLVEFSLNLPLKFKVNEELGAKYLMKRTLYELVPQAIFDRPKRGFSIPLNHWLSNELKPMLDKYLSKQKVEFAGLVEYKVVNEIVQKYITGKVYYYNRVWALLVLHWWFYEKA